MFKLERKAAKIFLSAVLLLTFAAPCFAGKIPDNIQNFISKDFPNTTFRFDGVIILPDNTIYLPLFPAKIIKATKNTP